MSYTAYRDEDGKLYSESSMEEMFADMLNESVEPVVILGMSYDPARALQAVDPISYRCALNDYLSEYAEESFESFDEMWNELD